MAWFNSGSGSQGGDLIAASGGDFTTLAAFEDEYDHQDISSSDGVLAEIKGNTGDTSLVYWVGWKSGQSSSCKIVITAESGCGITDRTSWTGADGSGDDAIIDQEQNIDENVNILYMDIHNVEFAHSSAATAIDISGNVKNVLRVWNCLFRDVSRAFQVRDDCTLHAGNLLIRDIGQTVWGYDASSDIYFRHITTENTSGDGFLEQASGTYEVINSVGGNFGSASDYMFEGTIAESYCASDDATADGTGSIANITLADNWTDYTNEDYTVKDTDADIYQAGHTTAPAWFTDMVGSGDNSKGVDITGTSYASTPSIGCFEYAVGTTPLTAEVADDIAAATWQELA